MVTPDPARYGVPGSDTRPSAPSSHVTPPIVYRPGGQPAAVMASVTRIDCDTPRARIIAFTADGAT
jgi:hypothetical protein